jgi:hypothetical protein
MALNQSLVLFLIQNSSKHKNKSLISYSSLQPIFSKRLRSFLASPNHFEISFTITAVPIGVLNTLEKALRLRLGIAAQPGQAI